MRCICLHKIKLKKKTYIQLPTDEVEIPPTWSSSWLNSIDIVLLVESGLFGEKMIAKLD